MTLTAAEREQIHRHVLDTFGGVGPEDPADHLAQFAITFANQANPEGRRADPLMPGQVLVYVINVLESLPTEAASEAQEALWGLAPQLHQNVEIASPPFPQCIARGCSWTGRIFS